MIRTWHRRPEQHRLYTFLRPRLDWLDERAVLWKFTGELVGIAIGIITSRTTEFGVSLDGLRPPAFAATDGH